MTDDDRHWRTAQRVVADATAEHRANPAIGLVEDIIARHVAVALKDEADSVADIIAEAAGAMGRRQA